jgi:hypothetical protein
MLSIKTTPLLLFLLLLIVLVISVLLGKKFSYKEGLVDFQQNKNSLDTISIPTYSTSNNTVKLHDQIFFDTKNGNIIEVDSDSTGNVDSTGVSIKSTYIYPRDKNDNVEIYNTVLNGTVVSSQDTQLSKKTTTISSYNSYSYKSRSINTDTYIAFCFPWEKETFIHLINFNTKNHVKSFYFNDKGTSRIYEYPANTPIGINNYSIYNKANNNNTTDPFYDPLKSLHRISSYIKYDITNGNLIIQTTGDSTAKSITIYDRTGTPTVVSSANRISNTSNSITSTGFTPFTAIDNVGKNIVLYIPYNTNTVIALIGYNQDKSSLIVNNVFRFTSTQFVSGEITGSGQQYKQDNAVSEYYKWYWYWNNNESSRSNYSDDYLLKTQIVPPVCPACSTCSTCTNCGGNGGSGTISKNGTTVVGGNTIGGVVNNTVDNVTDVAGAGLIGTGMAVGGVALGASELGSAAINTTGSVIKDVSKDATGLLSGAVTGVKDILTQNGSNNRSQTGDQSKLNNQLYGKDNTSTIGPDGKKLSINRTEGAFQSPYGTTTGTQSGDQYSYYGALPSKGNANFMPVTSDFSAFGR